MWLGGAAFPCHAALLAARCAHLRGQLLGVVGPHGTLPHRHTECAGKPPPPPAAAAVGAASAAAVRAAGFFDSEPAGPTEAVAEAPLGTCPHVDAANAANDTTTNTSRDAVAGSNTIPLPPVTILLPHQPSSSPAAPPPPAGAPPAAPTTAAAAAAAAPAAPPCPHAAAFPHLLRYMYTGRLDVPPHLLQVRTAGRLYRDTAVVPYGTRHCLGVAVCTVQCRAYAY